MNSLLCFLPGCCEIVAIGDGTVFDTIDAPEGKSVFIAIKVPRYISGS